MKMLAEDFGAALWRRYKQDMEERLVELRRLNDSPSLTTEQTFLIRGQIKEVKRILSLGSPSEGPEVIPE